MGKTVRTLVSLLSRQDTNNVDREAWRYTGPFLGRTLRWKGTFPGLGIASAAFGVYLAYDTFVATHDEEHH
jgi:hypothetical protein